MGSKLLVVADSTKAQFYQVMGHKIKTLLGDYDADTFNIGHERAEKKSSFNNKTGVAGHSFEPHTTPKEADRSEFSKKLSELIYHTKQNGEYAELMLIAEPKMLGAIRKNLDGKLGHCISKEISKDMAGADPKILETLLFE